jgi:hypothetical protein
MLCMQPPGQRSRPPRTSWLSPRNQRPQQAAPWATINSNPLASDPFPAVFGVDPEQQQQQQQQQEGANPHAQTPVVDRHSTGAGTGQELELVTVHTNDRMSALEQPADPEHQLSADGGALDADIVTRVSQQQQQRHRVQQGEGLLEVPPHSQLHRGLSLSRSYQNLTSQDTTTGAAIPPAGRSFSFTLKAALEGLSGPELDALAGRAPLDLAAVPAEGGQQPPAPAPAQQQVSQPQTSPHPPTHRPPAQSQSGLLLNHSRSNSSSLRSQQSQQFTSRPHHHPPSNLRVNHSIDQYSQPEVRSGKSFTAGAHPTIGPPHHHHQQYTHPAIPQYLRPSAAGNGMLMAPPFWGPRHLGLPYGIGPFPGADDSSMDGEQFWSLVMQGSSDSLPRVSDGQQAPQQRPGAPSARASSSSVHHPGQPSLPQPVPIRQHQQHSFAQQSASMGARVQAHPDLSIRAPAAGSLGAATGWGGEVMSGSATPHVALSHSQVQLQTTSQWPPASPSGLAHSLNSSHHSAHVAPDTATRARGGAAVEVLQHSWDEQFDAVWSGGTAVVQNGHAGPIAEGQEHGGRHSWDAASLDSTPSPTGGPVPLLGDNQQQQVQQPVSSSRPAGASANPSTQSNSLFNTTISLEHQLNHAQGSSTRASYEQQGSQDDAESASYSTVYSQGTSPRQSEEVQELQGIAGAGGSGGGGATAATAVGGSGTRVSHTPRHHTASQSIRNRSAATQGTRVRRTQSHLNSQVGALPPGGSSRSGRLSVQRFGRRSLATGDSPALLSAFATPQPVTDPPMVDELREDSLVFGPSPPLLGSGAPSKSKSRHTSQEASYAVNKPLMVGAGGRHPSTTAGSNPTVARSGPSVTFGGVSQLQLMPSHLRASMRGSTTSGQTPSAPIPLPALRSGGGGADSLPAMSVLQV